MARLSPLWILLLALLAASATAQLAPNITLSQASTALLPERRVQTELKLDAKQKKALDAEFKAYEARATNIRNTAKSQKEGLARLDKAKVATATKSLAILTSPQRVRLRQIGMQTYGIFAVLAPDMVKELKLSKSQLSRLKRVQTQTIKNADAIKKEIDKAAKAIPAPKDKKDEKAVSAYITKVRAMLIARNPKDKARMKAVKEKGEAKALAVLTPAQQKKWTAMQGKKLVLERTR